MSAGSPACWQRCRRAPLLGAVRCVQMREAPVAKAPLRVTVGDVTVRDRITSSLAQQAHAVNVVQEVFVQVQAVPWSS